MPVAAAATPVTDSNRTLADNQVQVEQTAGNETVAVVITLQNDTARQRVSFGDRVTVTGGRDVQFMPVLFATTTVETIPKIESNPKVADVNVDRQVQSPTPAADDDSTERVRAAATGQTTPWGIRRVGADNVSDRLRNERARNVTVAVVDSGVDYTHPDLDGKVVWGANFTGDDVQYGRESADDNHGHGTAVAGIIAAEDNERGTVGIAPGARLYSIKVLDQDNSGSVSSLIKGLNAALEGPDGTIGTEDDADVIQMSVGTRATSAQLAAASDAASESAVIVNSVGNDGDGDPATAEVTFPAAYDETLAVAATDADDEATLYSSEGDAIDVAAPGNYVVTLSPGSGTTVFVGTSAATPHVSGTVALLLAADDDSPGEDRTTEELRGLVSRTADDIEKPGTDRFSGDGLVRADNAVAELLPATVERTTSETTVAGGETVTITQTAYATESELTVSDSFSPSVADAEIQTVTVNGNTATPADQSADTGGTAVSLRDLDIGDRVEVTYTVELPATSPEEEMYRIRSAAPDENTETEQTVLQLSTQASPPVDRGTYDRDGNQKINLTELSSAATDYANGKISLSELSTVAKAYSRSVDS